MHTKTSKETMNFSVILIKADINAEIYLSTQILHRIVHLICIIKQILNMMSFYDYYNIGCFKQKNNNNMRTVEECTNAGNSEIFVPSHETLLQFQFYA